MAIVIFAIPVTVYEIIRFNLSKLSVFESMTFKMLVKIMSYNVAKISSDGFLIAFMMVKMTDVSETVFV